MGPSTTKGTTLATVAGVAALGLVLRVAYTLDTHRTDSHLLDEGDAFFYGSVATNLVHGHGLVVPGTGSPALDHPPATVLLLSPASWLFDGSVLAQRLTMCVLGTATIAVVAVVGWLVGGHRAAIAAATLAAISPALWNSDALIMSETPWALVVAATLALSIVNLRQASWTSAVAAGAVVGLAVLTRPEGVLLLPLAVWVPMLLSRQPVRDVAARALVALLATAVVVAPWTLYATAKSDRVVLLSTNDGATVVGANCPSTYQGHLTGGWNFACVLSTYDPHLDPAANAAHQRHLGMSYARHHARRWPVVLLAREGRVWGWWRVDQGVGHGLGAGEGRPVWVSWLAFAATWAILPIALVGAVRLWRRDRAELAVLLAPIMVVVATAAMTYGAPRFRVPADVGLILLAAVGLTERRKSAATAPDMAAP